jgi:hypothetical protein
MSTPTPPIDLTHLKALEAKATPGPWKFHELDELSRNGDGMGYIRPEDEDGKEIHHTGDSGRSAEENRANGEFTTALRNAFPQLCRELEAARHEREQAVQESNRRDQKWMDGIDSICGRKLRYTLATINDAPGFDLVPDLQDFITSLQSQLSKAEEERDGMRVQAEKLAMALSDYNSWVQRDGDCACGTCVWCRGKKAEREYLQPLPQTEGREGAGYHVGHCLSCGLTHRHPDLQTAVTRCNSCSGEMKWGSLPVLSPAPVSEKGGESA